MDAVTVGNCADRPFCVRKMWRKLGEMVPYDLNEPEEVTINRSTQCEKRPGHDSWFLQASKKEEKSENNA